MNFFIEDIDPLHYDEKEQKIPLYLNITSIPKPKQPKSLVELQLMKARQNAPRSPTVDLTEILNPQLVRDKELEAAAEFESPLFSNSQNNRENAPIEVDEFAADMQQGDTEVVSKKVYQLSNHSLPRPRGHSMVYENQTILKSGKSDFFNDEEFKQYIAALGGKVCNQRANRFDTLLMCQNYNQRLFEKAKEEFAKRQNIEQFFAYVVNMTIVRLLQENSFAKRKLTEQEITDYCKNLQWTSYEESLTAITLDEIEEYEQLQEEKASDQVSAGGRARENPTAGTLSAKEDAESKKSLAQQSVGEVITNNSKDVQNQRPSDSEQQALQGTQSQQLSQPNNPTSTPSKAKIEITSFESEKTQEISSLLSNALSEKESQSMSKYSQLSNSEEESPQNCKQFEFEAPRLISDLFHSRVQAQTLKNELMNYKRPILLESPTGQGKYTILEVVANEINYKIVTFNNEASLHHVISTFRSSLQFKNQVNEKKILLIKEVEELPARDMRALQAAFDQNVMFPLVLATSDEYNLKLKIIKKNCVEIALEKLQFADFCIYLKKFISSSLYNSVEAQVQPIYSLDFRSLLNQLAFSLSGANSQEIELFKTEEEQLPIDLTRNVFSYQKNRLFTMQQLESQYFNDPMMEHCCLLQNYLATCNYILKPAIFTAELLSESDNILYNMYSNGNWGAAKSAAAMSVEVPALVSPIFKADVSKFGFLQLQYEMLGLGRQIGLNMAKELEYGIYSEQMARIVDTAYFCDQSSQFDCFDAQQFSDLAHLYGIDECKGKQRKELLKMLDESQEGLVEAEQGRKKLK